MTDEATEQGTALEGSLDLNDVFSDLMVGNTSDDGGLQQAMEDAQNDVESGTSDEEAASDDDAREDTTSQEEETGTDTNVDDEEVTDNNEPNDNPNLEDVLAEHPGLLQEVEQLRGRVSGNTKLAEEMAELKQQYAQLQAHIQQPQKPEQKLERWQPGHPSHDEYLRKVPRIEDLYEDLSMAGDDQEARGAVFQRYQRRGITDQDLQDYAAKTEYDQRLVSDPRMMEQHIDSMMQRKFQERDELSRKEMAYSQLYRDPEYQELMKQYPEDYQQLSNQRIDPFFIRLELRTKAKDDQISKLQQKLAKAGATDEARTELAKRSVVTSRDSTTQEKSLGEDIDALEAAADEAYKKQYPNMTPDINNPKYRSFLTEFMKRHLGQ